MKALALAALTVLSLTSSADAGGAANEGTRKKASPPKARPSPAPPQTMLIIWGGGAKPEDADKAIADFAQKEFTSSEPLAKFHSDDIPGLKPGFHIAALGACSGKEASEILRRVRRVYEGIYLRRVPREGAVAALKCPEVKVPKVELYFEPGGSDEPTVLTDEEQISAGRMTLTVLVTVTLQSNGEFMSAQWEAEGFLERGGKRIDNVKESAPNFAKVDSFDAKKDAVILETTDTASDCGTSDFFEAPHVRRSFRIKNGKIAVEKKIIKRESGACPPSPEGMTGCEWACKNARFEATQAACDNKTRAECAKARAKYDANAEPCECSPSDEAGQ